ncbi:MAG: hypothetical protein Q8N98_03180 [bacterium]|nr:hypothetical protein [bacterium]
MAKKTIIKNNAFSFLPIMCYYIINVAKSKIIAVVVGVFFAVALLLDIIYLNQKLISLESALEDKNMAITQKSKPMFLPEEEGETPSSTSSPAKQQEDKEEACSPLCLAEIKTATASVLTRVSNILSSVQNTPVLSAPLPTGSSETPVNQPKEYNIPVLWSASTTVREWTDVDGSDFTFDLANYPGAKAVRLEVTLKTPQGSGKVYARLYDVTNKRAVDYSEVSTNSSSYVVLVSGDIRIWANKNTYRTQLKSDAGAEGFVSSARLKIVY